MNNNFFCSIKTVETNFSQYFHRHLVAQAKEIARQCTEAPLRKKKTCNEPPFKPKPSLEKAASFLIDCVKRLPQEKCQFCKQECFPLDPDVTNTRMFDTFSTLYFFSC